MTDTYRERIDSICFSEADKAALLDRLESSLRDFEAAGAADGPASGTVSSLADDSVRTGKRHGRKRLTSAAIAALLAASLLGTGAYAASEGLVSVPEPLTGFLADSGEIGPLNEISQPIGKSVASNGVLLRADGAVGDSGHIMISYTLVREDGKPFEWLDRVGRKDSGELEISSDPGHEPSALRDFPAGGAFHAFFFDSDPATPEIEYVEVFSTDSDSLQGRQYRTSLQDIGLVSEDGAQLAEVLEEGSWELGFPVSYSLAERTFLAPGGRLGQGGDSLPVTKIALSPISLTIHGQSLRRWTSGLPDFSPREASLVFDDGSQFVLPIDGYSVGSARSAVMTHAQWSALYGRILDANRVVAVRIDGQEIPLRRGSGS